MILYLITVVITGPTVLFCSTGSNTLDMTVAEFSGGVIEMGVTTRVTVAMLLAVRLPRLQTTTLVPVHTPPLTDLNVTLKGSVSVTSTLVAVDGPRLAITRV